MQPTKPNIDGINRSPMPLNSVDEKRSDENATTPDKKAVIKASKVKTSSLQTGPTVVIVLTIVIMACLTGLAYFAYTKSK